MEREEFLEFIKTEAGAGFIKESGFTTLNKEVVENYLTGTDDGKSILFSQNDKEYNRRFEKFKTEGGLDKLIEAEYQKRHPNLTPEQVELRDARLELETMKRNVAKSNNVKTLREENKNYGLSDDILELIISDNFEESKNTLAKVGSGFKANLDRLVEERVAEALRGTKKPMGVVETKPTITQEQYMAMSAKERKAVPMEQLKQILNG